MNANKKNSGWILCPSNTFPGKFYYFNVLNGETAWSLTDAEKKILKKDGVIPKVTGMHHHLEPSSPPIPSEPTKPDIRGPIFTGLQHPTPVFGQSVFPKSQTKPDEPNVIWTQIQVPIILKPESKILSNQPSTPENTQITQTQEVEDSNPISEIRVQSCGIPLCQRFVNFKKPVITFGADNKIKDKMLFDKFYTSTPIREPILNNSIPIFSTLTPKTLFQADTNSSFGDVKGKITNQKQILKKTILNLELPSKTQEKPVGETPVGAKGFCQMGKAELMSGSNDRNLNTFSSDLRNLLLAKKRKTEDFGFKTTDEIENKKIKSSLKPESSMHPKKTVTFNLDVQSIPINDDFDNAKFCEEYSSTMEYLKNLAPGGLNSEQWCIVVDPNVVMEEHTFLDRFVQIDPKCKLFIPSAVYCEVAATSKGDCRGRAHVNLARNVMRRLANPHTIVQTGEIESGQSSINDAILKCCIEIMNRNIHLILITDNDELLTSAKCYPIHCYNIRSIKNGLASNSTPKEFKQMRITIKNDNIPKKYLSVDTFKLKLFDETDDMNEKEKEIIRSYVNQNAKSDISNENKKKSNENTIISNMNNEFNNKQGYYDNNINITRVIPFTAVEKSKNDTKFISNTNTRFSNESLKFSNENSRISNAVISNSFENLFSKPSNAIPGAYSTVANGFSNENSNITRSKALTTQWRSTFSDITEMSIDTDMRKLNLTEQRQIFFSKPPEKVKTTLRTEKKTDETVSFFQKPTTKFDFQMMNTVKDNARSHFQNGRQTPFLLEETTKPIVEREKYKPFYETANKKSAILEINQRKEPQNCVNRNDKLNMAAHSIFESHKYIPPQSIQSVNEAQINKTFDLSRFYVKNKIMENRLRERMDEWVCSFKQIMEESLSGVLRKLSISVLKSMSPPWSLYEALQNTKTIYKNHIDIKQMVDSLCEHMFESGCRNDMVKKNINPNDLILSIGCGFHLIKYLKNILEPSTEIQEAEKALEIMLNQIEDPESDINEPLAKTPTVAKADDTEVRLNFVKNRSEIINYLKKHYSEWKEYVESNEFKIVRTFGKNQIKLDKKSGVSNVCEAINDSKKDTGENALRVNGNTNAEFVERTISTNNGNTVTKNTNIPMKNNIPIARVLLERIKVNNNFSNTVLKNSDDKNECINQISVTDNSERQKILKGSGNTAINDNIPNTKIDLERTKLTTMTGNTFKNNHIKNNKTSDKNISLNNDNNKNAEFEKARIKLNQINDSKTEKLGQNQHNTLPPTIINDNKSVNLVNVSNIDAKPKMRSIFNFMKPTNQDTKNQANHDIGKVNKSKFKIDSKMLDVKITILNDYKTQRPGNDKNVPIEDNINVPKEKHTNDDDIKHTKDNASVQETKFISTFDTKLEEIGIANDPKIIRNINFIKEFEERLRNKKRFDKEVGYSSDSSQTLDSVYDDTKESNCKKKQDTKHSMNNFNELCNGDKDISNEKEFDVNNHSEIDCNANNHSENNNNANNHLENNHNANNHSENDGNYQSGSANRSNGTKTDDSQNDRKSDDITNDSGLGNDSPFVYSVLKSFSSELMCSLALIEKFIDGSVQEFRDRRLSDETKKQFRLKAFEANFLITRIIIRLDVMSQRDQNDATGEKIISKNSKAVSQCLEHAQTLRRVLSVLLSLTEDTPPLNSSMSLNASS